MLTVPEAARVARRNPETVRRWIREGKLRSTKVGTQHLIDETELAGFRPLDNPVSQQHALVEGRHRLQEAAAAYLTTHDAPLHARVRGTAIDDRLTTIVGRIVRELDPVRIILFGSRARGDQRPDSDYDLLVVVDTVTDRRAMRIAARRSFSDVRVAADVIIATSEEEGWAPRLYGDLLQSAVAEGRVVYERA